MVSCVEIIDENCGVAVRTISNLSSRKPIPQWDLISSCIPLLCDLILYEKDEEVLADVW